MEFSIARLLLRSAYCPRRSRLEPNLVRPFATMHWWDEQFEKQSQSADFWFLQATRLRHAADILAKKHGEELARFAEAPDDLLANEMRNGRNISFELFPVYLLLFGLSLENLVKGILVARNPARFSNSRWLNHGLTDYVLECGLTLDGRRRDLLMDLEAFVLWKGRYPTPKTQRQWQLRHGRHGPGQMPGAIGPGERHELESLFADLCRLHWPDA